VVQVRIIAVPPGEAPPEVREKWVGLCLPIQRTLFGRRRRRLRTIGVLTGPRTLGGMMRAMLAGQPMEGYAVPVLAAIRVLEAAHPDTAGWWRAHASHLMRPGRMFVFPAEVCAEIEP